MMLLFRDIGVTIMCFRSPWIPNSARTSQKTQSPPVFFFVCNLVVACVTHPGNIRHELAVYVYIYIYKGIYIYIYTSCVCSASLM